LKGVTITEWLPRKALVMAKSLSEARKPSIFAQMQA